MWLKMVQFKLGLVNIIFTLSRFYAMFDKILFKGKFILILNKIKTVFLI